MDIYSQVVAASTSEALGRLGTTLAIKSYGPTAAVCCCNCSASQIAKECRKWV
jgi:hypothetical protein